MKKIILCMSALLLTLVSMAQTRQYMGAYTTDTYSASGLGLTGYPGTYTIVGDYPSSLFTAYDGGKVVGMRFAVAEPAGTTKCFISGYNAKEDTLAVARVTASKAGWNEVMFEKPFTLDLSKYEGFVMGYDYVQTSSNYPVSVAEEGTICESYIYGNLGNGLGYNNIGLSNYGNLCVQAIVEKDYCKNAVMASDFEDVYVKLDETASAKVKLTNGGTQGVSSINYTVTCDGKVSAEQQLTVEPKVTTFGGTFTVNIPLKGAADASTQNIILTITKVNGVANEMTAVASGKLVSVKKLFAHRVAVEEFTGTGCGYCPRGMQGMENLRETFGDSFVGIAIHQYNSGDAMVIASNNYKKLSFSGAPSCMIERGEEIDPYYGSNSDIRDDFRKVLEKVAPVGVEVYGMWNADQTAVNAQAVVEALADGNSYDIEYVLVGDELSGMTTAWKQSNYYYQSSASQQPADLAKFCSGGTYGKNGFYPKFNDVALASSYVGGKNQAATLGTLREYTPVQSACTVKMPTSSTLLKAVKYDQVYIIALVIDQSTGRIVNAAKSSIVAYDPTPVESVLVDNGLQPAVSGTFNLAGQRVADGYKGIVIKNGKKFYQK